MMHQLASAFLHMRQADQLSQANDMQQAASLDRRLAPDAAVAAGAGQESIDPLYEELQRLWDVNPEVDSADIIDCLRKFTRSQGDTPYRNIPTHTAALAQVMAKLKEDGGEDSAMYAALNRSLGFAVVSNGILNSFAGSMMARPEEPESW